MFTAARLISDLFLLKKNLQTIKKLTILHFTNDYIHTDSTVSDFTIHYYLNTKLI